MKTTMKRLSVLLMAIVMMIGIVIPATAFAEETGKDPVAGVKIPFGVYEPDETLLHEGSHELKIECKRVHVTHTFTAEISFSSTRYTEVKIGENTYEPYLDSQAGKVIFMLPVEINEPFTFTAHTTAMGGEDIPYTVTIKLNKDSLKPVRNGALTDGFYTTTVNTNKAAFGWKTDSKTGKLVEGFSYPSKDYEFPVTVEIKDGKIANVAYTQNVYSIVANTGSDVNYLMWAMDGHFVSDKCYQSKTVSNGATYHIDPVGDKNGTGMKEQFVGKTDIAGVDTVSAATLTSRGIINAVDQCLTKAERGQKDNPDPVLPGPDTTEDNIPADGTYAIAGDCIGADLDNVRPVTLTVKDGKIQAKLYIQQRAATYPHIFVGTEAEALATAEEDLPSPTDYDYGYKYPGTMYTGMAFNSLDKPQLFQMYASTSETWFNRPITLKSATLWDTTDRSKQDELTNNIVYSTLGMFRPQDQGTSVTKNDDGTYTVKLKLKPLASGKYDRMAIMNYPTGTKEQITKDLDLDAIDADKIEETEGPNGQTGEVTTLYSPEFTFKIKEDQIGEPIPFTYSQEGKWKTKGYYLVVLTDEEVAKRKQEIADAKETASKEGASAAEAAQAIVKDKSKYDAESYAAFEKALNDLDEVLAKEGATAAEINAAKEALDAAIAALKKKPAPVVTKKANPMTAKAKAVKIKYAKLKKKTQKVKKAKAFTIKKAQGKVTFKLTKKDKKAKSKIKVSKAGVVTVKKGLKKGKYTIKIKVTAAGNASYKAASKTIKMVIKVK